MIYRTAHLNGVRYTLESFRVKLNAGAAKTNYGIKDDAGTLYAWIKLKPAEEHWDLMFPRALAQQEAA